MLDAMLEKLHAYVTRVEKTLVVAVDDQVLRNELLAQLEGEQIDVTECPDCGETGRYDGRVKVRGRGVYACPAGHRWQDLDEVPSTKGYIEVTR